VFLLENGVSPAVLPLSYLILIQQGQL
jgi:hypothetical protein